MNRIQFLKRFEDAIIQLYAHTHILCFNDLNPNHQFILSPNVSSSNIVLDDVELDYIKELNEVKRKPLSIKEVLDLVCKDDRVPLWINMSVYEASDDVTLIELICSRRLRKEEELVYKVDKYPPFHILTHSPPEVRKKGQDKKFDVNWRAIAEKQKEKSLANRIKGYFSKK